MPVSIDTSSQSNLSYVDFGDIIQYEIVISNIGDTSISNCYLVDTLPTEVTFTNKSVFINGVNQSNYNPIIPMTMPDLLPNNTITTTFECSVNGMYPFSNSFINTSNFLYSYTVTATNFRASTTFTSNTSFINKALVTVDKYFISSVGLNTYFPYSVVIKNFGNTIASNIILFDSLQNGMIIDPNSIYVDTVLTPGDLISGLPLNDLSPNNVRTIDYNVMVTSLPSTNIALAFNTLNYSYLVDPTSTIPTTTSALSYYANSDVISSYLTGIKSVNPSITFIGDTITYTISITNIGNSTAEYINLLDTIVSPLSFITNSVLINSTPNSGNPNIGISIPNISSSNTTTITFKALVTTIPTSNPITNTAFIQYKSQIPLTTSFNDLEILSSTSTLTVSTNNISIIKSSNKYFSTTNDIITYTFVITNFDIYTLENCILIDTISSYFSFIPNSVKINSSPASGNPYTGISLPNIASNEILTVSFDIQVL